ncbi:hypothetical protein Ancab_004698, partial [Ancistrocladus abbreviatus]
ATKGGNLPNDGGSFSNFKPKENELAIPTPIVSRPTDGMEPVKGRNFAPFQEARCRTEGTDSLSKCAEVGVSKSQGWEGFSERNPPLFLFGLERPIGSPLCTAQVRDCNRAVVFAGPGTRPKLLKRTEDTPREDASVLSLSSGPNQIKTDRGTSKRIKK